MNSLRDAMNKTSVNLITLDYSNVETYKIGQKGLGIKMDGNFKHASLGKENLR